MSDAVIFVLVFGGIFVLRIVLATVFFCAILPEGDRCPNCDAPTLRMHKTFWHRFMPWFRPSWCYHCGWHGMLRSGPITPIDTSVRRPPGAPIKSRGGRASQPPRT